ncbi:uncharacterized protein LOC133255242 [Bos javanicus]|uniref:uncharacterized protein LOC133255242 n=1 Tax=Bos javanicus TaxID=9906 RepID=UPI002AA618D6|nr:uncharacterized protein LOC133255242 [Bos javanicus]
MPFRASRPLGLGLDFATISITAAVLGAALLETGRARVPVSPAHPGSPTGFSARCAPAPGRPCRAAYSQPRPRCPVWGSRANPRPAARNPSPGPSSSYPALRLRWGRLRPVLQPGVRRSGQTSGPNGLKEGRDKAREGGSEKEERAGQRNWDGAQPSGGHGRRRERALSSWQRIPGLASRNRNKKKKEEEEEERKKAQERKSAWSTRGGGGWGVRDALWGGPRVAERILSPQPSNRFFCCGLASAAWPRARLFFGPKGPPTVGFPPSLSPLENWRRRYKVCDASLAIEVPRRGQGARGRKPQRQPGLHVEAPQQMASPGLAASCRGTRRRWKALFLSSTDLGAHSGNQRVPRTITVRHSPTQTQET